ncbi:MAG: YggT family protein [Lentilactobacillus diolivorans]|nr:YggT family protein [Lentilactobacillus diolivorans]MDH5105410.1 YggT family protein [Lentilactobacillus diolivorans]GEP24021.1 cell division protein [Lentilactobacillus diolivorans]
MVSIVLFVVWLLNKIISIYMLAIVVYALMSWFPNAYGTAIGRFLARIVEPFERLFDFATVGMISLAPVVALIVLSLVQGGITYLGRLLLGV